MFFAVSVTMGIEIVVKMTAISALLVALLSLSEAARQKVKSLSLLIGAEHQTVM